MEPQHIALSTRYIFCCAKRTKKAGLLSRGFAVPDSAIKVNINDLGEDLMALAFYQLHQLGYIQLAIEQKTVMHLFKRKLLTAKRLKRYLNPYAIEAKLMDCMSDEPRPIAVIIDDYFGKEVEWPQKNILMNAIRDAIACDLGFMDDDKRIPKHQLGFNPILEKITALKASTEKELTTWDSFKTEEAHLASMLKKEVSSAVNLKTKKQEYT